jgi:hypothetical protein
MSMKVLLLHPIAKTHICNRSSEERDRHSDPQKVLHGNLPGRCREAAKLESALLESKGNPPLIYWYWWDFCYPSLGSHFDQLASPARPVEVRKLNSGFTGRPSYSLHQQCNQKAQQKRHRTDTQNNQRNSHNATCPPAAVTLVKKILHRAFFTAAFFTPARNSGIKSS